MPACRYLQALPEPQWVQCDIRTLDMQVLGKFGVIMADPPWQVRTCGCARLCNSSLQACWKGVRMCACACVFVLVCLSSMSISIHAYLLVRYVLYSCLWHVLLLLLLHPRKCGCHTVAPSEFCSEDF